MSKNEETINLKGLDAPVEKHPGVPPELLNPASQAYMNSLIGAAIREAIRVGDFKASDVPIVHQEIIIVSRGREVAERTQTQTPERGVLHLDVPNAPTFPQLDSQKWRRECPDGSAFDF